MAISSVYKMNFVNIWAPSNRIRTRKRFRYSYFIARAHIWSMKKDLRSHNENAEMYFGLTCHNIPNSFLIITRRKISLSFGFVPFPRRRLTLLLSLLIRRHFFYRFFHSCRKHETRLLETFYASRESSHRREKIQ